MTLPPLQALRAFEAVARLKSFRRAGEELLITQSAVSHHIGGLEKNLGIKLFIRKAPQIEFTPEGERYFETIRRAFDLIASATAGLRGSAAKDRVRVSLLPSFAANWLVPRLQRFAKACPDIDLVLDPTLRLADLDSSEADVAIRFGDGRWDGVESTLLMTERLTPVASPALFSDGFAGAEPKDLLGHKLLFASRPYEWDVWAEANGLDLAGADTIQLTDYNIIMQAAVDGQGVAMGRLLLIADRLRSGALVQLSPSIVTSPRVGHWLVRPKRGQVTIAAQAFADWLAAEAAMALAGHDQG